MRLILLVKILKIELVAISIIAKKEMNSRKCLLFIKTYMLLILACYQIYYFSYKYLKLLFH